MLAIFLRLPITMLDRPRLFDLRGALSVPLSLHAASFSPADQLILTASQLFVTKADPINSQCVGKLSSRLFSVSFISPYMNKPPL